MFKLGRVSLKKYGKEKKQLKNFGYSKVKRKRKKNKKDYIPGYLFSPLDFYISIA